MIRPAKKSASELMKKATPSTLGSIPCRRPRLSWPRPASGMLLAAMADLPIRAIVILVIPERAPATDLGQRAAEVLRRRWRRRGPLQRVGVPGVVAGLRAVAKAGGDVPEEHQAPREHEQGADARQHVQLTPARVGR